MRRGELVALDWRHVDWNEKRLLTPAENTKTAKPRTLPLYKSVRDILDAMGRKDSGLVFGTTANGVKKAWLRALTAGIALYNEQCRENGQTPDPGFLRDLHFHDLRHEGTSRLLEHRLSLPEVQSITGHTVASKVRRYAHIRADTLADKLDAMERAPRLSTSEIHPPAAKLGTAPYGGRAGRCFPPSPAGFLVRQSHPVNFPVGSPEARRYVGGELSVPLRRARISGRASMRPARRSYSR